MMHTSTSPMYPIVASTETAAAMMRGNVGRRLIDESIERAIRFPQGSEAPARRNRLLVLRRLAAGKHRREGLLGVEARRRVARLQEHRRRPHVPRPDQGDAPHPGHEQGRHALRARHPPPRSSRSTSTTAASSSRRPVPTTCSSSSAWGSTTRRRWGFCVRSLRLPPRLRPQP